MLHERSVRYFANHSNNADTENSSDHAIRSVPAVFQYVGANAAAY